MGSKVNLLGALGLGALAMYLLDPDRGRRRRAMLRDKAIHAGRITAEAAETTARDLSNRTTGILHDAPAVMEDRPVSDRILGARVRSRLGRLVSHPRAIDAHVHDGVVTLTGHILADEMPALIGGMESVRGVRNVEQDLSVHRDADVPELQGGTLRREAALDILQRNWAPATRLLASIAGGALALGGLRRGGFIGSALSLAGAGLLTRGATNTETGRLLGVNAGRRAVDVQKAITIQAPVSQVFNVWRHLQNLPTFMGHLESVRELDDRRSYWVARGPAGARVQWDAIITKEKENELLAWKSISGSPLPNAGVVHFEEEPNGRTRVNVRMSYNPPGGAIGDAAATLLGVDPHTAMEEDLLRFKSLLEDGKTTVNGKSVRRKDLVGIQEGRG